MLSRRGFVVAQPHKRPRNSIIRFEAEQPNERWQADITQVRIRGRYDVEGSFTAVDVVDRFARAAESYGTPATYLTDNAAVFTGSYRGHGWEALERELVSRGVLLRHSRPYHPQTCGKVERFHQTMKKHLERQGTPATISELQDQLDVCSEYCNDFRPHRALGRRTPRSAFEGRPKAVPTGEPLDVGHFRARQDVVDYSGTVTLRHNSRLHHVGIGRRHAGRRVFLLVHDLSVRVVIENGELLRAFTPDPTKDYQPLTAMVCPS